MCIKLININLVIKLYLL